MKIWSDVDMDSGKLNAATVNVTSKLFLNGVEIKPSLWARFCSKLKKIGK